MKLNCLHYWYPDPQDPQLSSTILIFKLVRKQQKASRDTRFMLAPSSSQRKQNDFHQQRTCIVSNKQGKQQNPILPRHMTKTPLLKPTFSLSGCPVHLCVVGLHKDTDLAHWKWRTDVPAHGWTYLETERNTVEISLPMGAGGFFLNMFCLYLSLQPPDFSWCHAYTDISLGQVYPEISMLTFYGIHKSIFLSVWGWCRKST